MMARKQTVDPDPEDLRKDLLAALAAGRELGPEMDTAIVDAHLRRHYGEEAMRSVQPATPPPTPARVQRDPMAVGMYLQAGMTTVVIVAVVAAVVIWQAFPLLFFLWPLLAFGAFGRRRGWGHGRYRYDRRWDRRGWYDERNEQDDWHGPRDDGMTTVAHLGGSGHSRVVSYGEIV
jgi:hypothetical protein